MLGVAFARAQRGAAISNGHLQMGVGDLHAALVGIVQRSCIAGHAPGLAVAAVAPEGTSRDFVKQDRRLAGSGCKGVLMHTMQPQTVTAMV
eukprot:scaffold4712_cov21-Tisochrysis_lutea.AAC.2